MGKNTEKTGCCEPFNPEPWQDKEVIWQDKLFIKDSVICFCHIPLNMKQKIIKNINLIEQAHAMPENLMLLSDEKSSWGANIYLDITKEVAGALLWCMNKFLDGLFLIYR